jgi:hypothetical protein
MLEVGDLLVGEDGRLVRVLELVPVEPPARNAALVRVARREADRGAFVTAPAVDAYGRRRV